jgi:outer membrane protein
MKKFSLIHAGLLCLGLAAATSVSAQQLKLATVDMKRVFDSYYKTKQAEAQIKDRAADSDKVYKGMVDDYQKANDDYRKLVDSANDQAVSADERDKRKKNAESKLMEIQEIEKSVKQFRAQAQETLSTMERRMRDNIVKEIRDLVNTKGKSAGYNMVFDTSAQTVYQTPFILYTQGQSDLTDDIIKDLNASAPPGTLSALEEKTETKAKK